MATNKLKNGEQFMVVSKTYRVIDDELFELRLERVSTNNPADYMPIPCFPIYPYQYPYITWYSTTTTGCENP